MRTLLKLTALLIGMVIIGLVTLPFVINPSDYKPQITAQIEKMTGRTLTIDGDIDLAVFPWVALELGPMSLSNAPGFSGDYFARVNKAEIRIKLMPLLSKKLEMDTIILDGLMLNLQQDKAGKTNWDDLITQQKTAPKTDTSASTTQTTTANATPALAAISIAGIQLSNASIDWRDAGTDQHVQLQQLNLTTDPLVPGEPTALKLEGNLISHNPKANIHIKLASRVAVDLEKQQYHLTDITLNSRINAEKQAVDTADISLAGNIMADLAQQAVTLKKLVVNINARKDARQIKARLVSEIHANLAAQQHHFKAVDLNMTITDPALPGGKVSTQLNSELTADIKQQTVSVSDLRLAVNDLLLTGRINARHILSADPQVAGQLQIAPFNLRQLAQNMAVELPLMADDSTLTLLKASTRFTASARHFNAEQLAVTLDQSHLEGHFAIQNFSDPAYQFKLTLDSLDADRYLPPAPQNKGKVAPPASAAAAGASQLPLQTLRKVKANGTLDIGSLKINGLRSEKIHLEIHADKGRIQLTPLSARLYQGQYQGNVNLNAQGKVLHISLDEKLTSVQAGPLLKDLTGDDKLSGTAHAAAKLTGSGASIDEIKQTLNGKGSFAFKNGAIKGINIAESIRKAKAALKGKPYTSTAAKQTDFASLTGTFSVNNGLVSNQDLALKSPLLRMNGHGILNLPEEAIDYALQVAIVGTLKGEGGKQLAELKGLTIPVRITGSFDNPKPAVDLASLLKEKAKNKIKNKIEKKLKGKLGGRLGKLLGSTPDTQAKTPANNPSSPSSQPQPGFAAESSKEQVKSIEDQAKEALKNKLKSLF